MKVNNWRELLWQRWEPVAAVQGQLEIQLQLTRAQILGVGDEVLHGLYHLGYSQILEDSFTHTNDFTHLGDKTDESTHTTVTQMQVLLIKGTFVILTKCTKCSLCVCVCVFVCVCTRAVL